MKTLLLVIQIIISVLLIVLILMQARAGGLGTAFGGSGQIYRSKRGIEKLFVYLTVILAALFFIVSIIQVLI